MPAVQLYDYGTRRGGVDAAELPLVFVQAQLGHATIATTMKRYGHLEPTYLRDAAALADQAVFTPIRDMA